MYRVRHYIIIMPILAAMMLLVVGCEDSKVVQCGKLIEVVNKGHTLINAKKEKYDAKTTQQLAQQLNQMSTEIAAVLLEDQSLKQFQSRFVKTFQELSQALNDISKALDHANQAETTLVGRQQINRAKSEVMNVGQAANQIAATEDALTHELMGYCSQ